MGIFGWSLPPGCGTLPGEEPEGPCDLCGRPIDDCECSECPTCGEGGCVKHLPENVLLGEFQRIVHIHDALLREIDSRSLNKWACPKCGTINPYTPLSGDPGYCQNCQKWDYELGEQP